MRSGRQTAGGSGPGLDRTPARPLAALRAPLRSLTSALYAFGLDARAAVVVAFSGGADSLGLLALLTRLPASRRPVLEAVCVEHGRAGAWAEARAAARLARELGVDCRIVRVRPSGRGGPEARARRARYAALAEVAAGRPVLTAHTADDQAETVLLRLSGGGGAAGLGGIRRETRLSGARVLRPLLELRRDALRAVPAALGLRPVEDPTNASLALARNRLRAEVLPQLERARPGSTVGLVRASALARADERYLARRTARAAARLARDGGLDAARLLRLPEALRTRVVRARLLEVGLRPTQVHVRTILAAAARPGAGEVHLPHGYVAAVRDGVLRVAPGRRPPGRGAAPRR